MWKMYVSVLLLVACCVPLPGCAFIKPETKIGVNPFTRTVSLYNTKDVDVAIALVKAETKDGGSVEIRDVLISDKASPVITANVPQMLAFAEQQRAGNEGLQIVMSNLSDVVREAGYLTNPVAAAIRAVMDGLKKQQIQLDSQIANLKLNLAEKPPE